MKKIFVLFMITISCYAQDWANLSRYEKENEILMQSSESSDRVVFMGNSITEGWIKVDPNFFKDNNFVNRGISGQTTPQMLIRFRQDVINLKPKAVVILAGTNDLAGNTGPSSVEKIEGNIKSMCELAKSNNIKVILCSILPAYDYPWRAGIYPTEKILEINKWMKEYTNENNFSFVDYFTQLADENNALNKKYSGDGVHPNEVGYSIMKPIVLKAITEALKNYEKEK